MIIKNNYYKKSFCGFVHAKTTQIEKGKNVDAHLDALETQHIQPNTEGGVETTK